MDNPDQNTAESPMLRYLIPSKAVYFFLYGATGSVVPYLNAFIVSSSLSVEQAGIITGIRYLLASMSMIFLGIFADYYQNKRNLILILLVLSSSFLFCLPWVTYGVRKSENIIRRNADNYNNNNKSCHRWNNLTSLSHSRLVNKSEKEAVAAQFRCDYETEQNDVLQNEESINLFIGILIVVCAFSVAIVPTKGFIDALVIQEVNQRKPKAVYGHQRVFSPIGYMIFSLLAGIASDMFPVQKYMSKYTAIFLVNLPVNVMLLVSVYIHPQYQVSQEKKPKPWLHILKHCRNAHTVVLLITLLHCGMANYLILGYLAVFLEEFGTSKSLIGLIVATSALAEILAFFFSAYLKRLFKGTFACLTLATLSYSVRLFLYYFLKNPYLFIPVQLLQGFGFALFWAVTVEYVEKTSPPQIKMTMFTIMHLCYFSAGGIISNFVGGIIYKVYGGSNLFMCGSIVCGIWTIILIIFTVLIRDNKTEQKETKELSSLL